jgi:hypothetical protein
MPRALPLALAIGLTALATAFACSGDNTNGTLETSGTGGKMASSSASGSGGDIFITVGNGGANASSAGSGGVGGESCAKSTSEGKITPATILFVVDRSGSQNCNPPPTQSSSACELNPTTKDTNKPTKWQVVSKALKDAIAKLSPTTSAGIVYFATDDKCAVTSTPAVPIALMTSTQLKAIQDSIDGVKPSGATPIVGGLTLGYKHLYESVNTPGNEFVVFITDGSETCAPKLQDKLISETVPNAKSVNIRTFVVGTPGSEPGRSLLSRIAFAGGTASNPNCKHDPTPPEVGDCHFDLTDINLDLATELNKALTNISSTALSCDFDVPPSLGKEVDYNKVNVSVAPSMGKVVDLGQDNQPCDKANGWQYNADKTKIVLCGPPCDTVKKDAAAKVTITLGCKTVVVEPPK